MPLLCIPINVSYIVSVVSYSYFFAGKMKRGMRVVASIKLLAQLRGNCSLNTRGEVPSKLITTTAPATFHSESTDIFGAHPAFIAESQVTLHLYTPPSTQTAKRP